MDHLVTTMVPSTDTHTTETNTTMATVATDHIIRHRATNHTIQAISHTTQAISHMLALATTHTQRLHKRFHLYYLFTSL